MSSDQRKKRIEEVEIEIEDSKNAIAVRLDALGGKLTPDYAKRKVAQTMNDTTNEMIDEARRKANDARDVAERTASHAKDRAEDVLSTVAQGAQDAGQQLGRTARENPVPALLIGAGCFWLAFEAGRRGSRDFRDRTDDLGDRARARALDATESAKDAGDRLGRHIDHGADRVGDQLERAAGDASDFIQRQPLTATALAAVGGFLVGAALPSSKA